MYGAINGSYINFGGLNAAGGEAINVGYSAFAQQDQSLLASVLVLVDGEVLYTQEDQVLASGVSVPIEASCAYMQEDQSFVGAGSVIVSASLAQTEAADTLFAFCENTMVRKVLGSSLSAHGGGSGLTVHSSGSRITGVH